MNFGFQLEWDELDEDLREDKISKYLRKMFRENNDCIPEDFQGMTEDEYVNDEYARQDAEQHISNHFPMYF